MTAAIACRTDGCGGQATLNSGGAWVCFDCCVTADPISGDDEPHPNRDVADDGSKAAPSTAAQLVDLAQDLWMFGVSTDGHPYAVPKEGPRVAHMLRGGKHSLRAQLSARYLKLKNRPPNSSALADAMLAIEGLCLQADPQPLALRVASVGTDRLILDLGDDTGICVHITADGWRLAPPPDDVLFRRHKLTSPLPEPRQADVSLLDGLKQLVNVAEKDQRLLIANLVAGLFADVPHPIAALWGEQGSGKTSLARIIVGLVDPSIAPIRTAPRDVEQWAVAANGSWCVALDNLSTIQPWLSDALCRFVTGDALVRRQLYTDDQVSVLNQQGIAILTSIDPGALAGDLGERLCVFELEPIRPDARQLDTDLQARFQRERPAMLGALLDLTGKTLAALPIVDLPELPRMADFARIVAAVDVALGHDPADDDSAFNRYLAQAADVAGAVVEADPVGTALDQWINANGNTTWTGTASALLDMLTDKLPKPDRPPRNWPKQASVMGSKLAYLAPSLRQAGISVTKERRTSTRREWTIAREGP